MTQFKYYDRIPTMHCDFTYKSTRFVICENPSNDCISEFLQLFEALNVKYLAITSVLNYSIDRFVLHQINICKIDFDH